MQARKPVESLFLTVRAQKVTIDSDLAGLYGVPNKALNQPVKCNTDRFPAEFRLQLIDEEKEEVVTNCDHLSRLEFSHVRPFAFTEHGALMAVNVLNSPDAVRLSVYVVRFLIKQRESLWAQADVLKKLAQMDARRLQHDDALRVIWRELQPLINPPPDPPKPQIGFGVREEPPRYRTRLSKSCPLPPVF